MTPASQAGVEEPKVLAHSPALDVDAEGWVRLSVLAVGLCFFINAIDGMNVLLMSYLAPSLAKEWGLASTTLGIVFSSALVGMAIGGLCIAPLGDRLGRRPLILAALFLMSAGMVASGFSANVTQLIVARTAVGIGIGTVLACMAALVAEFAPPRRRNFAVGLLQGGYPIGATATGFLTAWALTNHSWRSILLFSGFGSLAFFPLVYWLLPESASFLTHAQPRNALQRINRIRRELKISPLQALPATAKAEGRPGVLPALLSKQLRHDTLLLWGAVFFGFIVLYSIVSWIPKLAIDAGLDPKSSIYAGAIYNLGAFAGTVLLSGLANRAGLKPLIVGFLLAAAALLILFGGVVMPVGAVLGTAFAIGVTLQGGFNGLYPLSACVYPVRMRSSGLGWAMGIGRAGAVIGPLLSGYILSLHLPLVVLFATLAVPLVIAALCTGAIRHAVH